MDLKLFFVIAILSVIIVISWFAAMSYANEETITGIFITATRVYMPDNNIKLVIYFNETDNIKFYIFDSWKARHSIQLSNMDAGDRIKIYYKDYVFKDYKEIVGIEVL